MTCPHCGHAWDMHTPRCTQPNVPDDLVIVGGVPQCGCMWSEPKPPESPPPPPSARTVLADRITTAIFDELDRQNEADEIDAAGYWDREWGRLDGEPNWGRIAHALIDALELGGDQ